MMHAAGMDFPDISNDPSTLKVVEFNQTIP
jgi:hypothetical protein